MQALSGSIRFFNISTSSQIVVYILFSFLLVLMSSPLIADVNSRLSDANLPLVIVNGDTIYSEDLDDQIIQVHQQMNAGSKLGYDYRKLLTKLVNDRLIIQEAYGYGLDREPWLMNRFDSLRSQKAVSLYIRDKFQPDLTVDEKKVQVYFNKYYARMQLRTISLETQKSAENVAAAISNGQPMDSIAAEISIDMYRYGRGLHNFKYYGDIEDELRKRAEVLAVGELSQPFPYREVWALLRLEKRAEADPTELEKHRPKIESVLKNDINMAEWNKFMDKLAAQYNLTEFIDAISEIRADSSALFTPGFIKGTDNPVFTAAGGLKITDKQLRTAISKQAMTMGTAPFDSILTKGHKYLRDRLALLAGSRAEGYRDRPDVDRWSEDLRDSLLIEVYIQETVASQITFNRDEFEDYYQTHIDEYRNPTKFQFDRITAEDEDVAKEIYSRLVEGGDFGFVGRQFDAIVATPEESSEWVSLMVFPESIRKEIAALTIGQSASPHPTSEGWLVLRKKSLKEGQPKPLANVEMSIRAVIFQKKFSELLDQTLNVLKDNSIISYDEKAIDIYFGIESDKQDKSK